jgi:outer membrane lipopolysaccharide assembly protein LptE/RlpB
MKTSITIITTVLLTLMLTGCGTNVRDQVLDANTGKGQVQTRSIQTRAFDTTDKEATLRTVIATLQDLSFVIDKADIDLGSVSGTKLDGYAVRMTVSVRPRNESQLIVRANATFNDEPILEPKPYQDFFNALSKALFLDAQAVE